MKKKLSEMSLEELWQLFPIVLKEHNPIWKDYYNEEETLLKNNLPNISNISHIGSTSIPSIWAKPIIDILVETPKEDDINDYIELILKQGYICIAGKVPIKYFCEKYYGFSELIMKGKVK